MQKIAQVLKSNGTDGELLLSLVNVLSSPVPGGAPAVCWSI